MWADRRIAQLIRRPETLNHSRLQAAAALHCCCLWENEVLEKLTPWGAPDSARLSAWLAGLLEVE